MFFKRETMGRETGEICKEEEISASNCWVMLHRARLALRECLDRNWFQGTKSRMLKTSNCHARKRRGS